MKCLSYCVMGALAIVMVAGTTEGQSQGDDVEKLKSDLAATQKMLEQTKQTLKKSEASTTALQAKLDAALKAEATLRKELESEKAAHKQTLAKVDEAVKQAQADARMAQAKLADAVNAEKQAAEKLAKAQADLTAKEKALNDASKATSKNQSELTAALKARDDLMKQIAAERAQLKSTAAELDQVSKEATQAKSELAAAQKALEAVNLAKSQLEQEAQKNLADAAKTADGLRKSLATEKSLHKSALAKLADLAKQIAQTKADLANAQDILGKQPPQSITVVVTLPPDAQLEFDGHRTSSLGSRRSFVSPPVALGPTYYYNLKAEFVRDGKTIVMQKQIEVHGGDSIEVSLSPAEPAVKTPAQPPSKATMPPSKDL